MRLVRLGVRTVIAVVLLASIHPAQTASVRPVPKKVRTSWKLDAFYAKYTTARGIPVVASKRVDDHALLEAAYLVTRMLDHRPSLAKTLVRGRVRVTVIAHNELTTDIPDYADLRPKAFWDRRARGLGAVPGRPCVSGSEENLLQFPGDPYWSENILIHEFAHALHEMALGESFDRRLRRAYARAIGDGLWKGTYAATDHKEYFAEGAQSWFDTNQKNTSDHNHVDTRDELVEYDPALAALCKEVFGARDWRYVPPKKREKPAHLATFDRTKAPRFQWPADLPELPSAK